MQDFFDSQKGKMKLGLKRVREKLQEDFNIEEPAQGFHNGNESWQKGTCIIVFCGKVELFCHIKKICCILSKLKKQAQYFQHENMSE